MPNILITGGDHIDRIKYATALAQKLLCREPVLGRACELCINCQRVISNTHPNMAFIEPPISGSDESLANQNLHDAMGTIKIDQIRQVVMENQKANFENGLGIFIITHMHQTTKSAANALLKAIEESHENKVFMVLAPSRMAVLPTIASRLVCHSVKPPALSLSTGSDETLEQILCISKTPPKDRFPKCAQFSADRKELASSLDNLLNACHQLLRQDRISPRLTLELSEAFIRAESNLKKNLNPRLVAEQLVLREWPFVSP